MPRKPLSVRRHSRGRSLVVGDDGGDGEHGTSFKHGDTEIRGTRSYFLQIHSSASPCLRVRACPVASVTSVRALPSERTENTEQALNTEMRRFGEHELFFRNSFLRVSVSPCWSLSRGLRYLRARPPIRGDGEHGTSFKHGVCGDSGNTDYFLEIHSSASPCLRVRACPVASVTSVRALPSEGTESTEQALNTEMRRFR